ncbi:MAG TPA: hypothetical protein VFB07_04925 [Vicinamibacterales bacterium]|nr:hypothetical protein [Vicinamibacterales bacterium]
MMRPLHTAESASFVRWVFLRGTRALTCEVRVVDRRQFDVCVVPLWDVKAAVIETYDRAADAMRRHAELATGFRQSGWVAARQTGGPTEVAA